MGTRLNGAKFWILDVGSHSWSISRRSISKQYCGVEINPVTDNDFQIGDNLEFTRTSSTGYTVDDLGYLETNFSRKYQIKSIADGMIHVDCLLVKRIRDQLIFSDKKRLSNL